MRGRKHIPGHNLSYSDRLKLEKLQNNKCLICNKRKKLQLDHDHSCCPGRTSCGKCIRGFVCAVCNSNIYLYESERKDKVYFLLLGIHDKIVSYLEVYNARRERTDGSKITKDSK